MGESVLLPICAISGVLPVPGVLLAMRIPLRGEEQEGLRAKLGAPAEQHGAAGACRCVQVWRGTGSEALGGRAGQGACRASCTWAASLSSSSGRTWGMGLWTQPQNPHLAGLLLVTYTGRSHHHTYSQAGVGPHCPLPYRERSGTHHPAGGDRASGTPATEVKPRPAPGLCFVALNTPRSTESS